MHEGDRHAALAHARSDALDRAMTHVARREYAGDACLEQKWVTRQIPFALLCGDRKFLTHSAVMALGLLEQIGPIDNSIRCWYRHLARSKRNSQ